MNKTVLYAACYLNGVDGFGNNRLLRNKRYIEYYTKLKPLLGFDDIFLLDNSSDLSHCQELGAQIVEDGKSFRKHSDIILYRCRDHLAKGPGPFDYPYCWRALYFMMNLFTMGYNKIICIDTDGFVLSKRLAHFVKTCDSGWHTMWCPKWAFPEASFMVINKDTVPLLKQYTKESYLHKVGKIMENDLPYTHIHKEFNCDRFGEDSIPQAPTMDYYGQASLNIPLTFKGD